MRVNDHLARARQAALAEGVGMVGEEFGLPVDPFTKSIGGADIVICNMRIDGGHV